MHETQRIQVVTKRTHHSIVLEILSKHPRYRGNFSLLVRDMEAAIVKEMKLDALLGKSIIEGLLQFKENSIATEPVQK